MENFLNKNHVFSAWKVESKNQNPSLMRALIKAFLPETIILGIFSMFTLCVAPIMSAAVLEKFLSYFR